APLGHRHFVSHPERLARSQLNLIRTPEPDVDEGRPVAQGYAHRIRVIELAGPAQISLHRRGRLVWEAQVPERPCLVIGGRGAVIVPKATEQVAMDSWVIDLERPFNNHERFLEATFEEPFQRQHTKSDEAWPGLRLHFSERRVALR